MLPYISLFFETHLNIQLQIENFYCNIVALSINMVTLLYEVAKCKIWEALATFPYTSFTSFLTEYDLVI